MATNADAEVISMAAGQICKAAVIAIRWAGMKRKRALEKIAGMPVDEKDREILFLRERVAQLEDQVSFYRKQSRKAGKRPRYSIKEIRHLESTCAGFDRPTEKDRSRGEYASSPSSA
jgi:hypothetical protein